MSWNTQLYCRIKKSKIRADYSDMFDVAEGKMMLPSTKRFLSILFGFVKKESVKNRIMSVGAAVLENTLLFPIILFSPTTFTLLHFKRNSRQHIKKLVIGVRHIIKTRTRSNPSI